MNALDILKNSLQMSETVVGSYLDDLDDADLLVRAVPGMNHIAWQLGHIIAGENHFLNTVKPGSSPELPADFVARHGKEAAVSDDPSKFYTKAEYQELFAKQRAATRAVIDTLTEKELDRTGPEFPPYAPTAGAMLNLCGTHPLMHAGQWVAVRRKLGKPITI